MQLFNRTKPLDKRLVFITGAPRSGTSMLTKVIDAHPDVAVLMENIFDNRRRHWKKAGFWNSPENLKREVSKIYSKLDEPIVGNKVCTPDVWSADDILMFCSLFSDFKIVFIVRDSVEVAMSRFTREDYEAQFNDKAKQNILLNFRSRFLTYTSSWTQSIENYWKLRDGYHDKVYLVYYEDFCRNFEYEVKQLFKFLDIPFSDDVLNWQRFPHHDAQGNLKKDLKYKDTSVEVQKNETTELSELEKSELSIALSTIQWQREKWKERSL